MPEPKKAISRIAGLREKAGLTQAQLAVLIGVTSNTIQNWETGKSGVEQIERFLKLCEVLGCNLNDLIEYVSDDSAEEPKPGTFSLEQLRELRQRWGAEGKTQPPIPRPTQATDLPTESTAEVPSETYEDYEEPVPKPKRTRSAKAVNS
jgi:transcriptional regulator with XRE-family HTH domain